VATTAKLVGLTRNAPCLAHNDKGGLKPRFITGIHTRERKLYAAQAVRALAWMSSLHARKAAVKLKKLLPDSEWQALQSTRYLLPLPAWMAELI